MYIMMPLILIQIFLGIMMAQFTGTRKFVSCYNMCTGKKEAELVEDTKVKKTPKQTDRTGTQLMESVPLCV